MADIETLGILDESQTLVYDKLQVVYSVQACIPKDPATLWKAEFVQAEELFKQPITVDNCLRDNRKRKLPQLPPNNKKGKTDRNSSVSGGALANMWGRACAKPKRWQSVVWEGEETEIIPEIDTTKKTNNAVKNAINRPPETKKSPAMGSNASSNPAGKVGSKKGRSKDPKQGNILSFFKKV